MSSSYSEYLRRKMAATPQIVAPRPLGDASMVTQIKRMTNTTVASPLDGGQRLQLSSEAVVAARAGCGICEAPVPQTVEIACCPPTPDLDPKPAALQGTDRGCCQIVGPPIPYVECCREGPVTVRTWQANDVLPNVVPQLPPCVPCPGRVPDEC